MMQRSEARASGASMRGCRRRRGAVRAHRGAGVHSRARRQARGRVEELVGAVGRDAVTGEGEEGHVRAHIEK